MTLILPQTKFEVISPKDIQGDTFLVKADASCQILGFGHNKFSSVIFMDLTLKFLESQSRDLSRNVYLNPPLISIVLKL